MSLLFPFTDNRMESYIIAFKGPINAVVRRNLNHLTEYEKSEKDTLFQTWIHAQDKETVSHFYCDSGWRALYSKILYKSRIMTVLHTFDQLKKRLPDLVVSLRQVSFFVSIGCGPGPEIAAMFMILYGSVGVSHPVKALGVDQYDGWREYVESLHRKYVDGNMTEVRFDDLLVDQYSINAVDSADMCIMSYTDAAMHTSLFWRRLKEKYSFIVILDQRKPSLARLLQNEGYEMVEYAFKDTKRFFYWMSPRGVCKQSKDSSDKVHKKSSAKQTVEPQNFPPMVTPRVRAVTSPAFAHPSTRTVTSPAFAQPSTRTVTSPAFAQPSTRTVTSPAFAQPSTRTVTSPAFAQPSTRTVTSPAFAQPSTRTVTSPVITQPSLVGVNSSTAIPTRPRAVASSAVTQQSRNSQRQSMDRNDGIDRMHEKYRPSLQSSREVSRLYSTQPSVYSAPSMTSYSHQAGTSVARSSANEGREESNACCCCTIS